MHRVLIAAVALVAAFFPALGHGVEPAPHRAGQVGWARLKTPNPEWSRHSQRDYIMLDYIRDHTNLNIGQQWESADVAKLDELTRHPFLFAESIALIRNPAQLANLREYLLRGGFLFLDACINTTVNPDPDAYFRNHVAALRRLLPEAEIRALPGNDPIYAFYFHMEHGLPHGYMQSIYNPAWAKYGLHAVTYHGRMVALISLSGLQCGWYGYGPPGHREECVRMMVNIYLYALTQP